MSVQRVKENSLKWFWFIMVIAGIKVHSNTLPFFGTLETGRLLDFNKIQPWPCYFQQKLNRAARTFPKTIWFTFYCYHSFVFTPRFSCICHHLILRNFFKIFPFKIWDAELILSFTTAQPPRFKVLFLSENVIRVMICRIILAFGIR